MAIKGAGGNTESQLSKGLYLSKDELNNMQGFQTLVDTLNVSTNLSAQTNILI